MLVLAVLKAVITVLLKYCILTLLAAWWKSDVTLASTVHFYSSLNGNMVNRMDNFN